MMIRCRGGRAVVVAAICVLVLSGCSVSHGFYKVASLVSPVPVGRRGAAATSPVARYEAARKLFLRGQYSDAADAFETWARDYPASALEPAALYYLGSSQANAGRPQAALAAYERVIKDYGKSDWGRFAREDMVSVKANRPVLAGAPRQRRWWRPSDWFTPDPPAVKEFKAARDLFDKRKYDQAIIAYRALAEKEPENPLAPAAWHYVAQSYERLGQLAKARDTLGLITKKYPQSHWKKLAEDDLARLKES